MKDARYVPLAFTHMHTHVHIRHTHAHLHEKLYCLSECQSNIDEKCRPELCDCLPGVIAGSVQVLSWWFSVTLSAMNQTNFSPISAYLDKLNDLYEVGCWVCKVGACFTFGFRTGCKRLWILPPQGHYVLLFQGQLCSLHKIVFTLVVLFSSAWIQAIHSVFPCNS